MLVFPHKISLQSKAGYRISIWSSFNGHGWVLRYSLSTWSGCLTLERRMTSKTSFYNSELRFNLLLQSSYFYPFSVSKYKTILSSFLMMN